MTETVVVLSTADFNAAVWTNKQHLAIRLARHMNVSYVESMGLRQPTISLADVRRVMNRLVNRSTPQSAKGQERTVRIIKPHVLPFHNWGIVRRINAWLLHKQMGKLVSKTACNSLLWTFSPVTYGIEKHFARVVYHSVDLLHTLPHMPVQLILRSERELLRQADVVIASSTGVRDHLQSLTEKNVELWQNVADTNLYSQASDHARASRAVFAGNLTASKVNFSLLHELAATGTEVIIAGPTAIDGTQASQAIEELKSHPNVTYAGNLVPTELARLLNTCTVGLIPYYVNEYTAGVFPMKIYEYLASGLAVVSTTLPSLNEVKDEDILKVTNDQFVDTVLEALTIDDTKVEARRRRASLHSWEARTMQALAVINRKASIED
jgi:teichuronic acid biosynthesis glycosyltransferase TuaH